MTNAENVNFERLDLKTGDKFPLKQHKKVDRSGQPEELPCDTTTGTIFDVTIDGAIGVIGCDASDCNYHEPISATISK